MIVRSAIGTWVSAVGQRSLDRAVAKAAKPAPPPAVLGERFRAVTRPMYTPPDRNARNGLLAYETNPFVNVVVDRVAAKFAGQDWYLRRRKSDDGERIVDHPALSFLRSGSEIMDGYQSRKLISMHLDLAGETFLLLGYDSNGVPASYIPLPPNWITQPAYRDGDHFEFNIPRTSFAGKIPWRGMIWLKRPRPSDPTGRGFSATQALLTEISLHDELATFFYSFVKNRARPDIIITGSQEDPLSHEDARALETRWVQQHQGTANAGKPMISNAPLEVTEVGQTMQESQLAEMRKMGRDFILQVYGVQPSVFGIIENANRATAEAADFTMARDVIEPRLKAHSESLYPRLLIEFPDLVRYTLHFESPVAEDKEFKLNVIRAAPRGFRVKDARALADFPPDPEMGDERLQEKNVDLSGSANGDPNALADGNTDSSKKLVKALPRIAIQKVLTEDQIAHLQAGLEDNEEGLLLLLAGALRSAVTQSALDLSRDRGVSIDDLMQEIDAWAATRAAELLVLMNETSRTELRTAVEAAGDDRSAIGGAILALFALWLVDRVRLIATTEANGAMSIVERAIGRLTGSTSKVWLTMADERVRSIHRPMHGQVRGLNEPFTSGNGEHGQGPGLFPSALNNVNCRCGTRSFKGDPPSPEALAGLAVTHEGSLRIVESVAASGVRAAFYEQQRAVLQRLGSIR